MHINSVSNQLPQKNFSGLWGQRVFKETFQNKDNKHIISYYELPYYPFSDERLSEIKDTVNEKLSVLNEKANSVDQNSIMDIRYDYTMVKIKDKLTFSIKDYKLILEGFMPESLGMLEVCTKAFNLTEKMEHLFKK